MNTIRQWLDDIMKDKCICEKYTKILLENDLFLVSTFGENIPEKEFLELIEKSYKQKYLQNFINAISGQLRAMDVSDKVFTRLIKYKRTYRNSILVGLSHCDLSFYQLEFLLKMNIDENVFCKLLSYYLENSIFKAYDLERFITNNSHYKDSFLYVINNYNLDLLSKEKKEIVKRYAVIYDDENLYRI